MKHFVFWLTMHIFAFLIFSSKLSCYNKFVICNCFCTVENSIISLIQSTFLVKSTVRTLEFSSVFFSILFFPFRLKTVTLTIWRRGTPIWHDSFNSSPLTFKTFVNNYMILSFVNSTWLKMWRICTEKEYIPERSRGSERLIKIFWRLTGMNL